MALKGVAKFKGKLTCGLKDVIRNLFKSDPFVQAYKDLDEKVHKSYFS